MKENAFKECQSLHGDAIEIIKLITSIIKTLKSKINRE